MRGWVSATLTSGAFADEDFRREVVASLRAKVTAPTRVRFFRLEPGGPVQVAVFSR